MSDDSLSMTKPIAIVKGGLEALYNLFKQKRNEKAGFSYILLWGGVFFTIASIG